MAGNPPEGIWRKMGYRALLTATDETVQDLEISASRRLDEANALCKSGKYHTAIYIAGLAAEMYLKTACYFLGGAKPSDIAEDYYYPLSRKSYKPSYDAQFESGHGLWFWSQEIIQRRRGMQKAPNRFLQVMAVIFNDWFIGMRYRPGKATKDDAERFIIHVGWLASNHARIRR